MSAIFTLIGDLFAAIAGSLARKKKRQTEKIINRCPYIHTSIISMFTCEAAHVIIRNLG